MHGGREVDPEPNRVSRFPLALTHEELVGGCRAAPINAGSRVVHIEVAELPEGFAGAGTAAAMGAVDHGMGDTLRLDEERRHTRRKPMGLGFLA